LRLCLLRSQLGLKITDLPRRDFQSGLQFLKFKVLHLRSTHSPNANGKRRKQGSGS
jgi:hypothetical protein